MHVENWKELKASEYLQLDEVEQNRILTKIYEELFFKDVQAWGVEMINVMEAYGINDYSTGSSRVEIALGMLNASITALLQLFSVQNRQELQALSEDTVFAANLSTSIYDLVNQMQSDVGALLDLQTCYHAALAHRREGNRNLLAADGTTKPYSNAVLEKEREYKEQAERQWKQELQQQRQELEDAYWGRRPTPELEEGYGSAQMIIPLWAAGFKPEEMEN